MNKKVSIIIPLYNAEKYLEKCISSIVGQTYKNIEIILINDGSTDGSYEICYKFKTQDPRILFINQKNSGVSSARNSGIDLSSGEYIMFVDADDWLDSDYVSIMVNSIGKNDIIVSSFTEETESNDISKKYFNKIKNNEIIDSKSKLFLDCVNEKIYTYLIWGKLYKKQIIGNTRFVNQPYSEDAIFIRDIFCKCSHIKIIHYTGYHYRLCSGVTNDVTRNGEKNIGALKMLERTYKICKNQQLEIPYTTLENMILQTWYGTIRSFTKNGEIISKSDYDYIIRIYKKYYLNNRGKNKLNKIKLAVSIAVFYLRYQTMRRIKL